MQSEYLQFRCAIKRMSWGSFKIIANDVLKKISTFVNIRFFQRVCANTPFLVPPPLASPKKKEDFRFEALLLVQDLKVA